MLRPKYFGAYLLSGPDSAQRSIGPALHRQIAPVSRHQRDSSLCDVSAARHLTTEVRQRRNLAKTRCFKETYGRFLKPTPSSSTMLIKSGCVKTIYTFQRDKIFPQHSACRECLSHTLLALNNFIPFLHSFVSATGSLVRQDFQGFVRSKKETETRDNVRIYNKHAQHPETSTHFKLLN